MATKKVPETARAFFDFNGAYQVDPVTSRQDLLNDAACWLDGATAIVRTLACEVGDVNGDLAVNPCEVSKMLWGVWYLLNMTSGALGAAELGEGEA